MNFVTTESSLDPRGKLEKVTLIVGDQRRYRRLGGKQPLISLPGLEAGFIAKL